MAEGDKIGECLGIKIQWEEEVRQWNKIESLPRRAGFVSMGEYIKLVEREKAARGGCSAHGGKPRQTSGLSESSEINGGWIIYTPRLLWEKCLCSPSIKGIGRPVLCGPFRAATCTLVHFGLCEPRRKVHSLQYEASTASPTARPYVL